MNIAVVCANGKAGRLITEEAVNRGLNTTAIVRGENNRLEREIAYHFDKSNAAENYSLAELIKLMASETNYGVKELSEKIGEKLQDIELPKYNGKIQPIFCLAALDAKSGYGFNIYQIFVKEKNDAREYLLPTKRHFESYEDENLQTFFNGDK